MALPIIELKKGKLRSVQRRHPWVFSGAIQHLPKDLKDGDSVHVSDSRGNLIGTGFYGSGSIAVRLVSFKPIEIDEKFWFTRIQRAWELRQRIGLTESTETNIFRLIHAEGDELPGLIVDVYGDTAVFQAHNHGVHQNRAVIARAIQAVASKRIRTVFDKSQETLTDSDQTNGLLLGEMPEKQLYREGGHTYQIDWEDGQKTGFFIDQRENRQLLQHIAAGKSVLNTFCYTGGFSVCALAGGASVVHSVDSSASALKLCDQNVRALGNYSGHHEIIQADALQYIKNLREDYDIVVLDPPAFAKHLNARHRAVQAYKRMNGQVMRQMKPGGIIMTFSCSGVVDKALFNSTVMAASIESQRSVKILHQLHQPADHPINIFHPESEYLKGLVLQID